jgi:hypothetical protein
LALPFLLIEPCSKGGDGTTLQSPRRGFTVCALDLGKTLDQ